MAFILGFRYTDKLAEIEMLDMGQDFESYLYENGNNLSKAQKHEMLSDLFCQLVRALRLIH